jgi:hypothetical protein
LLAALTHGADEFGIAASSLPAVRGVGEQIANLPQQQEARLLASYRRWAEPVMLVLCGTVTKLQP